VSGGGEVVEKMKRSFRILYIHFTHDLLISDSPSYLSQIPHLAMGRPFWLAHQNPDPSTTGMHLTGMHLTGVHLTGMHPTGVYLTGMHLTVGLHLADGF